MAGYDITGIKTPEPCSNYDTITAGDVNTNPEVL
jgi:hypothetical protein